MMMMIMLMEVGAALSIGKQTQPALSFVAVPNETIGFLCGREILLLLLLMLKELLPQLDKVSGSRSH
jgi:hypothetical protein